MTYLSGQAASHLCSFILNVCVVFFFNIVSVSGKISVFFLMDKVEYVGHDLLASGNCPAQLKIDMVRDCILPTNGSSLHSFVDHVVFYH